MLMALDPFRGARTARMLVALAVERLYEVFRGANLLPVKRIPELLILLTSSGNADKARRRGPHATLPGG
jgi:hypothetical protein